MTGSHDTVATSVSHAARRAIGVLTAFALAFTGPLAAPATAVAGVTEVRKQLAAVRAEVKAAGREYDVAINALERTDDRIAATNKQLKLELKNLTAAEVRLGQRADALYRGGGQMGMADFILGAATWEDFVTRLDYATMIASSDATLIGTVKNTRVRLAEKKKTLETARVTQVQTTKIFRAKRSAIQSRLASKQAQYDKLMAALAAAMAIENPGGGNYPPGPNGQVFPVQGVYYYSNTWGAARSGGRRRHKGTDIMARTGTRCVATTNGTIRSKSSGLGGLTIYLQGDNGWEYYYAHLNGYAVRSGRVKAGQVIGYVGSTGNARGGSPHLHFQMGPRGNWVNPYPYLRRME
ncbi:MAG: peptidoglycan DD-metalloendopeptidase family protein [Coriobacteriia bacterium]|nr:peptidoglycan DD-metalloendopeptidase family protein [Coriobacteriia bacterium]